MSLVSLADCRALVTTPLSDNDLADVISRVESDITAALGAEYDGNAITEIHEGGCPDLFLKRRVSSVSSVTEYGSLSATSGTALIVTSDYFIWPNQGRIMRS